MTNLTQKRKSCWDEHRSACLQHLHIHGAQRPVAEATGRQRCHGLANAQPDLQLRPAAHLQGLFTVTSFSWGLKNDFAAGLLVAFYILNCLEPLLKSRCWRLPSEKLAWITSNSLEWSILSAPCTTALWITAPLWCFCWRLHIKICKYVCFRTY